MNILVPDSWLREYLETKATPKQIKEYLSLCGPSVERINEVNGDIVYDIEITTNRPDSMSVSGIAREAAAILPRFGIPANLINDPYSYKGSALLKLLNSATKVDPSQKNKLIVTTDPDLNPRWTSIVFDKVTIKPSPMWLQKKLELTGIRPLNNVIDITNYLMRAYGQPAHAFDYSLIGTKNGIPTMTLRASRKAEKLITLDGKSHSLPGGDIVIEDGSDRLIDLCGIMGGENSAIKDNTTQVILFLQTYDPVRIRKTSMALAHRTQSSGLFEKDLDTELVLPTFVRGIELMQELTGGSIASDLTDIYPKSYKPYVVSVKLQKISDYIGIKLSNEELIGLLTALGINSSVKANALSAVIPSWRRDITIDVDLIEEIARLYGYHNIIPRLPDKEPPSTLPPKNLQLEESLKIRLRDWGYTETYTYSMISDKLMEIFSLDKQKTYKISNPFSDEWVYMRPSLIPSLLTVLEQNLHFCEMPKLFELSMVYKYQNDNLPLEQSTLLVVSTGDAFYELKGLAETILGLFGVLFPKQLPDQMNSWLEKTKQLNLGKFGWLGAAETRLLNQLGIKKPVSILELNTDELILDKKTAAIYQPIPKYPPSYEDLAFVLPEQTPIGPLINELRKADGLISDITLLDAFSNTRTLHVTYLSSEKNLASEEIRPIREKLIKLAQKRFGAKLKAA